MCVACSSSSHLINTLLPAWQRASPPSSSLSLFLNLSLLIFIFCHLHCLWVFHMFSRNVNSDLFISVVASYVSRLLQKRRRSSMFILLHCIGRAATQSHFRILMFFFHHCLILKESCKILLTNDVKGLFFNDLWSLLWEVCMHELLEKPKALMTYKAQGCCN